MSMPTTARRAATRERLVGAAIEVIARKGVLAASVEEICEAADFTRGAFYSNFASKDDLCVAVLEWLGQRYLAAARNAIARMDPTLDVDERITRAVQLFITTSGTKPESALVMSELRLHAAREPALRDAFAAYESSVTPMFGELIGEGLRTAGLRLTIPMDQALSLLHAVHDQTTLDQLVHGASPDSPQATELLSLVLRAMITAD
ncbi:TetR/AcrR family transcriptional regulator [Luteococcus sp. Sow4_B9]|uniref:TetR/AcrR family transcriptional regulator n=1 Tax=Luteococcus sp. Sow4_B9 TaxID=3438792 RepID=UPI003F969783